MMAKKNALLSFIIFSLFFGSIIRIGPINLLNITSIGLVLYSFVKKNEVKQYYGYSLYWLYLIILVVTNIANSEFFGPLFWRNMIGYHLPCIAVMYSFPIIIKDNYDIKSIWNILLVVYIINLLISFLQFVGNPIAWKIGQMMLSDSNVIENVDARLYEGSTLLSISVVMGLFYSVVTNGYFVGCYFPIAIHKLFSTNKKKIILSICIICFTVIVTIMLQQRMAFLVLLFGLFILLLYYSSKTFKILFIFILFIIVKSQYIDFFSFDMGRLTLNQDDSTRFELFKNYLQYLSSSDVILGGQIHYSMKYGLHQHNTFLSASIYGGVFLLMQYLILYFGVTIHCIKKFFLGKSLNNKYVVSAALSCCFINLYSLTHTSGIQSGLAMFWIPYVIMMVALRIDKNKIPIN